MILHILLAQMMLDSVGCARQEETEVLMRTSVMMMMTLMRMTHSWHLNLYHCLLVPVGSQLSQLDMPTQHFKLHQDDYLFSVKTTMASLALGRDSHVMSQSHRWSQQKSHACPNQMLDGSNRSRHEIAYTLLYLDYRWICIAYRY